MPSRPVCVAQLLEKVAHLGAKLLHRVARRGECSAQRIVRDVPRPLGASRPLVLPAAVIIEARASGRRAAAAAAASAGARLGSLRVRLGSQPALGAELSRLWQ